jgi:hypothetical protein
MTYEEYLDEVATLLTEIHDLSEGAAIKCVMRAQAADFFIPHDEDPALRTLERAEEDADTLFEMRSKAGPKAPPRQTH